jgi:hypothetical protein
MLNNLPSNPLFVTIYILIYILLLVSKVVPRYVTKSIPFSYLGGRNGGQYFLLEHCVAGPSFI